MSFIEIKTTENLKISVQEIGTSPFVTFHSIQWMLPVDSDVTSAPELKLILGK